MKKRAVNQQDEEIKPIYAGTTDRMIASCIDLVILVLPLVTFLAWINAKYTSFNFKLDSEIDINQYLIENVISGVIFLIILVFAFLYMWKKYDSSLGKMLLSLKIADKKTLNSPSKKQYYLRILGYSLQALPLYFFFIYLLFKITSLENTFNLSNEQINALTSEFKINFIIGLMLSVLPFFVSLLSIPLTKSHQAWQDRISSTIVISKIDKNSKEYKDRRFKRTTYILIFTLIGILILKLLKN